MKILLIDNYDSFTYNLFHYISNFKKNVEVVRNDKINGKIILRKKYDKIVISPGPGNPNQAGNCLKIVKEVHKKIPILGVCLGHQIIGQVFGGKIINAKNLMHGKTSIIKHIKKGLFKGIKNNFEAISNRNNGTLLTRGCASRLVQCIDHFRLILFCTRLSMGMYMVAPICSVNWRPKLVLK